MKIALGIVGLALGVAATLGVVKILQSKTPQYGIILRATSSDITDQQWKAIRDVLKASPQTPFASNREYLYRIQDYVDGAPDPQSPELGKMDESLLLEDRRVPANFTGHAFQIGVGGEENSRFLPVMQMPQAHFRPNMTESQKMVDAVNNIVP